MYFRAYDLALISDYFIVYLVQCYDTLPSEVIENNGPDTGDTNPENT